MYSTHKGADAGKFELTAGKFYGDAEKDKGIKTSQDAKFYAASAKFDKPFSNEEKPLVVQFTVKHEQNIDCGGGYVKLFDCSLDQVGLKFRYRQGYKYLIHKFIGFRRFRKCHKLLNLVNFS